MSFNQVCSFCYRTYRDMDYYDSHIDKCKLISERKKADNIRSVARRKKLRAAGFQEVSKEQKDKILDQLIRRGCC